MATEILLVDPDGKQYRVKDPDAIKPFTLDFAPKVLKGLAVLTAAVFTVPGGLVKDSEQHDDTTATVWLSGGTGLIEYDVTCRYTLDNGTTDDYTFRIKCQET